MSKRTQRQLQEVDDDDDDDDDDTRQVYIEVEIPW